MADLDMAIRAKLAADDARGADEIYWDVYRDALLAVLDLHGSREGDFGETVRCVHCIREMPMPGGVWTVNEIWPCPTLIAVAKALGVEVEHG